MNWVLVGLIGLTAGVVSGLFGVGGDDLQIRLGAEREQGVVGAPPEVPAPGPGLDAEAFR